MILVGSNSKSIPTARTTGDLSKTMKYDSIVHRSARQRRIVCSCKLVGKSGEPDKTTQIVLSGATFSF
jgi:hypothetical protein